MTEGTYQPKQEVFTADEAKGIEEEVDFSNPASALMNLAQNPGKLAQQFSLTTNQTQNVKALLVAAASGGSVKYLGRHFGDELAAIIGAGGAAYLAKKMFGR